MSNGDDAHGKPARGDYTGEWDPAVVEKAMGALRPILKNWYRSEVRGLDHIPEGGALITGNHSGGFFTMDIPTLAVDFFERFGYDRQLYGLGHDVLFRGPQGDLLSKAGMLRASPDNAARALKAGATVIVYPGADYDAYRPTPSANVIDFGNHTGYVRTALAADVPIVPAVTIGGQENQLYVARGRRLARWLGAKRLLRLDSLPITFGFPSGFSILGVFPPNLPLPTKLVTQILEPIDVKDRFGPEPDIADVDVYVQGVMQTAMDKLAEERRLPVIG